MSCSPLLVNIKKSQQDYLLKIIQHKSMINQKELSVKEISFLLDEIKCFWLERLKIIDFELEELTEKHLCFLLSGAIYLNVSEYEHYYFKSLGDYHLLYDPFLKMENFFRIPEENINKKETIDYFKKVYADTIEILTKYQNQFFILPIKEIAIVDDKKHHEMLEKFFFNFLSSSFKKDLTSEEDFFKNYESFEEIEDDMDNYIRDHLILSDSSDLGLSLRNKIERYCKTQMNFASLIKEKTEPQIFFISIYSWISQIIDILLICVILRIYPYIRFDVTFHYLTLLMYTFIEDRKLKELIEKTIISYIFYKTINEENFKKIKFGDYCKLLENKSLLNVIISKIHEIGIDIFEGGVKQVESVIKKEFDEIKNDAV
jgi:hypothetical protein